MSERITISPPVSMAQRSDANSDIAIALAGLDVTNKSVTVDWSNVDAARPTLVDEVLYELVVRRSAAMVHVLCKGPHVPDTVRRMAVAIGIADRVQVLDGPRLQPGEGDPLDRPVTAKDLWGAADAMNEAALALEKDRMDLLTQILCRLANIETAIRDTRR